MCRRCGAWKGSLGLEPTPTLYIRHVCDIFDEVRRVLKQQGTLWVIIGDTYGGSWGNYGARNGRQRRANSTPFVRKGSPPAALRPPSASVQPKSLCLIPSRFAIEMARRKWVLRNEIVWWKPNCLPSSARDRFTVDFEKLLFFVKAKRYHFEQQLEPYTGPINRWGGQIMDREGAKVRRYTEINCIGSTSCLRGGADLRPCTRGRNMRTVWRIPVQACPDAHFASFPERLVETPIRAGCPEGGIVLDPFVGSGTSVVVARRLGRRYIGVDINEAYCKMARARLARGGSLKALE
ncbi:MAG: site-specific DNA-methyltransferase [Thermodesulfobacteriota bacterium]